MPYASAPTAPEEHYNSDRLLAWQREKKVRADAARRRKARQHAAAARAKCERERGENDLAARRVKKLEYVTYLREQFSARKEKSARKARRAPESQWDVDGTQSGGHFAFGDCEAVSRSGASRACETPQPPDLPRLPGHLRLETHFREDRRRGVRRS